MPIFDYAVWVFMRGEWRDIARDVLEIQIQHGSQPPNAMGHLLQSGKGIIRLWDGGGRYNAYKPAPDVDVSPRTQIEIHAGETILFRGWIRGVRNNFLRSKSISEMEIMGPLEYLRTYKGGIYFRENKLLLGSVKPGVLVNAVLDDVGWTAQGSGLWYTPHRRIDAGLTNMDAQAINSNGLIGVFNAGGLLGDIRSKPAQLLTTLQLTCSAETGRVYDTRLGAIHLEDRAYRALLRGRPRWEGLILEGLTMEPEVATVINEALSYGQDYATLGTIDIPMTTDAAHRNPITFPYTFSVSPTRGGRGEVLYVDFERIMGGNAQFVQDWEPISVSPEGVTLHTLEDRIEITAPNTGQGAITVTIQQPRGEPFRTRITDFQTYRSAESVSRFGLRSLIFPSNLFFIPATAGRFLEDAVNRHSGIDASGKTFTRLKQVLAQYNLNDVRNRKLVDANISDIVEVRDRRAQLEPEDAQFWVNSVEHRFRLNGNVHKMYLGLMDVRSTAYGHSTSMEFGVNSIVAPTTTPGG